MLEKHFNLTNLDADENVYFYEALRQVRSKILEVKYPELKARSLIPVDHEIDPGTESIVYRQFDHIGMSQIISSYAEDLPMVEVDGKEFVSKVKSHGIGYQYSIMDVKRSAKANMPLETKKAQAARKGFEFTVDEIAANGEAQHGLLGLLNQPNALSFVIPNNAAETSALWQDKTPDEILRDLNGPTLYMIDQTNGVETPDTMLLTPYELGFISTTPRSQNSDTTILDYFLKTNGYIKNVEPWHRLKGAGADDTNRMVVYKRDPEKLQLVIPQEFEQLPPQPVNLSFKVPCHGRIGGVVVYYPLSICYADGY